LTWFAGLGYVGTGQLVPPTKPLPLTVAMPVGALPPFGVLLPCTKLTTALVLLEAPV
jgi:hypothetical protein